MSSTSQLLAIFCSLVAIPASCSSVSFQILLWFLYFISAEAVCKGKKAGPFLPEKGMQAPLHPPQLWQRVPSRLTSLPEVPWQLAEVWQVQPRGVKECPRSNNPQLMW